MEVLQKETAWFLSDEALKQYAALSSLDERVVFLYAYLRTIAHENLEKGQTLMKIAFLLADGVSKADVLYAAYPALIRPEQNPFVAYVKNAKYVPEAPRMIAVMMAILQEKVDPRNGSAWIYDRDILSKDKFGLWLKDQGMEYLPSTSISLIQPAAYAVDSVWEETRALILWLFAKGGNA